MVGVDLGTSYSVIAVKTDGINRVIPHHKTGRELVPSIVSFDKSGNPKVGDFADEENKIFHAKSYIGRVAKDVDSSESFSVVSDAAGFAAFSLTSGKIVTPIQIGQLVVRELVDSVKVSTGFTVKSVVICVPVSFRNLEREHTRKVFTGLGLSISRVIDEPVAAALAYDLHKITRDNRKVMVFDLGGGTLDITILWAAATGSITVLGSAGDAKLGGQDFDRVMWSVLQSQCKDVTIQEAEELKIKLTTENPASMKTRAFGCSMTISNDEYATASESLMQRIKSELDLSLENQMMAPDQVDDVVLVGGSSRMPIIRSLLLEYYSGTKAIFRDSLNPDTVVALGAANVLD